MKNKNQKKKLKLGKIKRKDRRKHLSDDQLSTLISEISRKYFDEPFEEIRDKLDDEYREAFKFSNYEYHGYTTELGTIRDLDIIIERKKK